MKVSVIDVFLVVVFREVTETVYSRAFFSRACNRRTANSFRGCDSDDRALRSDCNDGSNGVFNALSSGKGLRGNRFEGRHCCGL